MINGKRYGMRNWMLGAVATGMIIPSMSAFGQSKSSIFINPKNSGRKPSPVQTTDPPRLLAVPDGDASVSPLKQSTSQIIPTAGEKTEVQKQLDALYEQDGREAPSFNLQPLAPLNAQNQQGSQPQQGIAPQQGTQNQPGTQAQQTKPATTTSPMRPGQVNTVPAPKPARPAQGYTQYQPRTQASPYPVQPSATSPRNFSAAIDAQDQPISPPQTQAPAAPQYQQPQQQHKGPMNSLFRRITGQNKYVGVKAPVPPDVHDSVPGVPPVSGSAAMPAMLAGAKNTVPTRTTVQQVQPVNQPALATTPVPIQASGRVQIIGGTNSAPSELPTPYLSIPALADAPLPLKSIPEPNSLPPLMTEPQSANVALKSAAEPLTTGPVAGTIPPEFPNPFIEVTESDADKKNVKPKASLDVALEAPAPTTETKSAELIAPPAGTVKLDDDPFAVKTKDFSEPSIDEKRPAENAIPAAESPKLEPPQLDAPPASAMTPEISTPQAFDPPSKDDANPPAELVPPTTERLPAATPTAPLESPVDPQVEKMRRIRERFGMKGLKGFCPVTLHDERDLVDARPEFHFTHRSQKFHFATAEARDKFEAAPSRYAPAAYGADVVALSRDKDVVEGTLDFAAWFKGRLYLFGTQANYDVFIGAPARYATLVEVE